MQTIKVVSDVCDPQTTKVNLLTEVTFRRPPTSGLHTP